MSPIFLFALIAALGAGLLYFGARMPSRGKAVPILAGLLLLLIGAYGVFTALL